MRIEVYLCLLVAGLDFARSKIFEKCELASVLATTYNVSNEEVKNLVCIAEYESTFNTGAINHFNYDGSKDYGLFQLNNKYWCGNEFGQNTCRASCESFLDDDLTDDLRCVQRIIKDTKRWMKVKNGYVAWVAYVNRCQNRDLNEYMAECSIVLATTTTSATKAPVDESTTEHTMTTTSPPIRVTVKTEKPERTSQQKPEYVRGPQIPISPIYKPIPVRESKPQSDEDEFRPSKTPLKINEESSDESNESTEQSNIQENNSLSVLEKLSQMLLDVKSQLEKDENEVKDIHNPTLTTLSGDNEAYLQFTKLHSETEAQVESILSNLFNFPCLASDDFRVDFKNHEPSSTDSLKNPSVADDLTRFPSRNPARIPATNNLPFEMSPILGQISSPLMAFKHHKYYKTPLHEPFITLQGPFPQFFHNIYGINNPYQNFPFIKNTLLVQRPFRFVAVPPLRDPFMLHAHPHELPDYSKMKFINQYHQQPLSNYPSELRQAQINRF